MSVLQDRAMLLRGQASGTGEHAAAMVSPAAALLKQFGLADEQIHKVHQLYMPHLHLGATEGHFAQFKKSSDWLALGMVLVCVCCAAIAAGLTLGLVSLDPLEMELKLRAGTEKEKQWASKVLPLIKRHHLLLVTLLLFNATANEALPLFLDKLVPQFAAVMISVTLVLIFGEITPSAIMTGPRQLQLAAAMSKPTWGLITLFFPIACPLGLVLDCILGHEPLRTYTRKELAELVKVQHNIQSCLEHSSHGGDDDHHRDADHRDWKPSIDTAGPANALGMGDSNSGSSAEKEKKSLEPHLPPQFRLFFTRRRSIEKGGEDTSKRESSQSAPHSRSNSQETTMARHGSSDSATFGRRQSFNKASSFRNHRLHEEEAKMLSSILSNAHKTVARIMVRLDDVFALDRDTVLTREVRRRIMDSGFSRIPVYGDGDRANIRGFVHVKTLFRQLEMEGEGGGGGAGKQEVRLRDIPLFTPLVVGTRCELLALLDYFKGGQAHMAIVSPDSMLTRAALSRGMPLKDDGRVVGIVTMEDVIEDLLMQDIKDEADQVRQGNKTIYRTATLRLMSSLSGSASRSVAPPTSVTSMINEDDDEHDAKEEKTEQRIDKALRPPATSST